MKRNELMGIVGKGFHKVLGEKTLPGDLVSLGMMQRMKCGEVLLSVDIRLLSCSCERPRDKLGTVSQGQVRTHSEVWRKRRVMWRSFFPAVGSGYLKKNRETKTCNIWEVGKTTLICPMRKVLGVDVVIT